jgi:glycosyltransferase involved in cell wall biosynthesis
MSARTTVVVSPRERFSPTIESLKSLFSTVPDDVPVIVVDGGFPAALRSELRELARERPFQHETREWLLLPNQARNIGTDLVQTEFVAYCDNDMIYEPGWLEALEAHADRTGVEVVAPLICIGPPAATTIHHAGGTLHVHEDKRGIHLKEVHNLMNRPIAHLAKANLPAIADTGEFHALFARTAFMRQVGALDERLMTREQNDFALRTKLAGGRVGFEPGAVVTYFAKTKLEPDDLRYHVFRWNHRDAVLSLDTFESTWGVYLERDRILKGWIERHRRRRIVEEYKTLRRWLGAKIMMKVVAPFVEWHLLRYAGSPVARRFPSAVPAADRQSVLADLAKRHVAEPVQA